MQDINSPPAKTSSPLSDTMYTLGKLTRCVYPNGADPSVTELVIAQPATGLAWLKEASEARQVCDDIEYLVLRIPPDLTDPLEGVSASDQGMFWLGYYQWSAEMQKAQWLWPADLVDASLCLFGNGWETQLSAALGLKDPQQVRQWLSGARAIPVGVWEDVAGLLQRQRPDYPRLDSMPTA
ncbi:hypothetical protein MHM84_09835 [Halomonas sp. McH1-25]|uniref:hypothetical protein n=1 Tax=unclassified Halomonas TaxID=2609666 RepID=UPI001EF3F1E6|nr:MULTISPECIES: hypothetical protein [unclassified Halomonas]MCG7600088.1 hypothetical protein [Halomonas sp. McH1-25]MCP1341337.1 hypothetical protein [Halomonas sp. FL8]MCP1359718.1 hypothetical protein [Halomonas sp. BBD45]